MAAPPSNDADSDADIAVEALPKTISVHFSSPPSSEAGDDYDYGPVPPSPEIGMAREGEGVVSDVDVGLEDEGNDEDEDDTDFRLFQTFCESSEQSAQHEISTVGSEDQKHIQPPFQQLTPSDTHRPNSSSEDNNSRTMFPACPPMRRSARAKSTLVYDQKYHPLDDIMRPSQAAKRRSLHSEKITIPLDLDVASEQSESEMECMASGEESEDEEPKPRMRGQKRKRPKSQSPEPTRRSSRRRTTPKVSYNMKIHPQDSDLARAYACYGSKSSPSPNKRDSVQARKNEAPRDLDMSSDVSIVDERRDDAASNHSFAVSSQTTFITGPSATPSKELDDTYSHLSPNLAYLASDRDMWPASASLPFHIYTERMEDQLNAEAEAASPLHYNDDDKENNVTNPALIPRPNPLNGISIIPASHYRQPAGVLMLPGHSPLANNAFYVNPQFHASPYGLGWSDGAHDTRNGSSLDSLVPEYMRILASSEDLPRSASRADSRSDGNETAADSSPTRSTRKLELLR